MDAAGLKNEIKKCRTALRAHRDAKGDDRCWVDDYIVWACLDDSAPEPRQPPSFEDGMEKCREFYARRRAEVADKLPTDAVTNPALMDADLAALTEPQLTETLKTLQAAIRCHRASASLTIEDDRTLYEVLPEKLPADFRLPPEADFLGEAKAPKAGCPSFWRSHGKCPVDKHNLHRWGPCGNNSGGKQTGGK